MSSVERNVAEVDFDHELIRDGVALGVGSVGPSFRGKLDAIGFDDVADVLNGRNPPATSTR
jgi:hypothetical protein